VRIVKRPKVLLDIEDLSWFILCNHREAGLRFPAACDATFQRLLERPQLGSPRRFSDSALSGFRVWPVTGFPNHLVFYFVREDNIEIVRVLHGARDIESFLQERV
jgi:toxin ParE1/3/4